MEKTETKELFISIIEKFITLASIRLSDDVTERLTLIRETEEGPMQKALYDSYFENFKLASELKKPICQDTGMPQFYINAGTAFPYLDITGDMITDAVRRATKSAPLRPNAVNFFSESNTGDNTGERAPWIHWDIIPNSSKMEITLYLSGAGCSLPGQAKVFKPSDGINAIIPFVFDVVLGPGKNACPPLLVGIGLGHNIENAALLSKKALLRRIGSAHNNPEGRRLEQLIMEELNNSGMGAQGLPGRCAVMEVHIESSARHTATIACAVNTACYVLRRGTLIFNEDLSYELPDYKGASL